jgi:hypothetical protein
MSMDLLWPSPVAALNAARAANRFTYVSTAGGADRACRADLGHRAPSGAL